MNNIKCFVPKCRNSKRKNPDKIFFYVRNCLRKKWCQQANVTYHSKYQYYCCEDHLNLQEDLENYQYWKLMKGRPRLKPTADLKLNLLEPIQDLEETKEDKSEETEGVSKETEEVSELQKLLMKKESEPPYKVIKPRIRVKVKVEPWSEEG